MHVSLLTRLLPCFLASLVRSSQASHLRRAAGG
eukprot:COSAG06_NODE_67809_length_251_cov_0.572368_1_plen_32_part_01